VFSKFLNLNDEKRNRILNAAIKEFAQKGYENASTNEIVKDADISKGLLFHYFKNKKHLFLFMFNYCIELLTEEIYKKIDLTEPDFFERINQTAMAKLELMQKYPEIFKFIETAYLEEAKDIKPELEKKKEDVLEINIHKIYHGIDMTKFRDDIDIQRALKTITWTLDGFGDEVMKKSRLFSTEIDYEKAFTEAEEYIRLLKTCFYK
jgi:TetR/AcrR family transcriptional regulator